MTLSEASALRQLLWAGAGSAVAVGLACAAAHWYEPPRVSSVASHALWSEADVLCTLASGAVALAVGVFFGRAATQMGATAAGSPAARGVIWSALTLLLFAVWVHHLFLFTLLIAPSHGFAALRLVGLGRKWRTEATWRRLR